MNTILMCEPRYYDVVYKINPWMTGEHAVHRTEAMKQWQTLKATIEKCGATIKLVTPQPDWPDLVFTANAALVWDKKAYLSHFHHPERQGERAYFKAWFNQHGFTIFGDEEKDYQELNGKKFYSGLFFEGAGDALFAGNKLFCAHGFRTNPRVYETIQQTVDAQIIRCQLQDPYYYHLDTCFCPLNDHQAIWWPDAFTEESKKVLSSELELFAIDRHDAKKFACNAVVLDQNVIIPSGCEKTKELLESLNFTVYECNMSEFIKAGGACKCLTLAV